MPNPDPLGDFLKYFKNTKFSFTPPPSFFGRPLGWILGLGVFAYAATHSLYSVQGGHRAVIFNRIIGVKDKVYGEGMHFMIPWFDRPEIFSIRTKVHQITGDTPSKDLQVIRITLRVLMKPQPHNLPNLYRHLGKDYDERVIQSVGPEVLKATVAQFNASELVTQREMVSQLIKKRLGDRVQDFWIDLEDVSITELNFGPEYLAAVESKQVAQQEAERAKFTVEKAKQSKLEIIVRAEGEAKAAKQFNQMLEQDKKGTFLELRKIEAAKEIANLVAKSENRVFLDSDNLMFNQITSGRDEK